MKRAKISELKNNLSRFLAYVRRGGSVRVFDREVPIADLVPCKDGEPNGATNALLADLERRGVVQRGQAELPPDILTRELPTPPSSVVAALLAERSEGR